MTIVSTPYSWLVLACITFLPTIVRGFSTNVKVFHSLPSRSKIPPVRERRGSSLSMGLTLYGSQGSRSPLVNWGAYELGVPFVQASSLANNPHPFGQIPCLVDDNNDSDSSSPVVLFESGAILIYLLDKAPATNVVGDRGAIISWIVWANASLDPICFLETPDGKVYDTGLKNANRRIDAVDALLSEKTYLLGDDFSLADVAVASYLLYVPQFFPNVDLSRWPNLVRYMKDCARREAYAKAFGPNVQGFLVQALDVMAAKGKDSGDGGESKKLFGIF